MITILAQTIVVGLVVYAIIKLHQYLDGKKHQ